MSVVPILLTPSTPLLTSATVLYVTPSDGQTVVKRAVFTNIDSQPRSFTVHRVPNGGSPVSGNIVVSALRLQPGESTVVNELGNMVLNGGESVQALASAASVINVTMSGFRT